jgi:hypothetical protein
MSTTGNCRYRRLSSPSSRSMNACTVHHPDATTGGADMTSATRSPASRLATMAAARSALAEPARNQPTSSSHNPSRRPLSASRSPCERATRQEPGRTSLRCSRPQIEHPKQNVHRGQPRQRGTTAEAGITTRSQCSAAACSLCGDGQLDAVRLTATAGCGLRGGRPVQHCSGGSDGELAIPRRPSTVHDQ